MAPDVPALDSALEGVEAGYRLITQRSPVLVKRHLAPANECSRADLPAISAVAASSEEFQNGRMAVAAAGKDSWFLPVHRKYRTLSPRSPAEEHRTLMENSLDLSSALLLFPQASRSG
jgi:hypothetical protein